MPIDPKDSPNHAVVTTMRGTVFTRFILEGVQDVRIEQPECGKATVVIHARDRDRGLVMRSVEIELSLDEWITMVGMFESNRDPTPPY